MGRTKTCPVARWPGSVVLPDYLNFPQYVAWRDAAAAARAIVDAAAETESKEYDQLEYRHAFLPGVLAVVSEWHLASLPEPLTPDNFPMLPEDDSGALFNWLVNSAGAVARGVDGDDPKSPPLSSAG